MWNLGLTWCRNDFSWFRRVLILTNPQQRSWSPKSKEDNWYDSAAHKIFLSIISQYLPLGTLVSRWFRWSNVWRGSEIRIQMHRARLLGWRWTTWRTNDYSWVYSYFKDHHEECFKSYQAVSLQNKSLPCHIFFRNALQQAPTEPDCSSCLRNSGGR